MVVADQIRHNRGADPMPTWKQDFALRAPIVLIFYHFVYSHSSFTPSFLPFLRFIPYV